MHNSTTYMITEIYKYTWTLNTQNSIIHLQKYTYKYVRIQTVHKNNIKDTRKGVYTTATINIKSDILQEKKEINKQTKINKTQEQKSRKFPSLITLNFQILSENRALVLGLDV